MLASNKKWKYFEPSDQAPGTGSIRPELPTAGKNGGRKLQERSNAVPQIRFPQATRPEMTGVRRFSAGTAHSGVQTRPAAPSTSAMPAVQLANTVAPASSLLALGAAATVPKQGLERLGRLPRSRDGRPRPRSRSHPRRARSRHTIPEHLHELARTHQIQSTSLLRVACDPSGVCSDGHPSSCAAMAKSRRSAEAPSRRFAGV